jgi:hypothetical protein
MRIRVKGVEHDVDPSKLSFGEGKAIEKSTGLTFKAFAEQLADGSVTALSVFVWILVRRSDPEFRFDDVDDLGMDELEFVTDPAPGEVEVKTRARTARGGRSARTSDPTATA